MVLLIGYISKPFLIQVFGGIGRRRNFDLAFCTKHKKIRTRSAFAVLSCNLSRFSTSVVFITNRGIGYNLSAVAKIGHFAINILSLQESQREGLIQACVS